MITSPPNNPAQKNRLRGFTLVEVIIAASIGTMILAGVLSTFVLMVRSGVRGSNYSIMEAQTRQAFEQLGIDARMANDFSCTLDSTSTFIKSITLTIPPTDRLGLSTIITYAYDTSDATDCKLISVPGSDPAATAGRRVLVSKVQALTFYRYTATSTTPIPVATGNAGIKHIQVSISVKRTGIGIANTTQVIRSSAFTMRNISI